MTRLTEERKETLLRRYGGTYTFSTGKGKPAMPIRRPGGFGRGPRGAARIKGGKPRNVSATIRRLLSYLGRDRIKIFFVYAFVLISSLSSLAGSYILRPVINNLVATDIAADEKLRNLVTGLLIMAGIYLAGAICTYLQHKIMIGVSQNALVRIREDLFSSIERLP
jgi:hypothetical protein